MQGRWLLGRRFWALMVSAQHGLDGQDLRAMALRQAHQACLDAGGVMAPTDGKETDSEGADSENPSLEGLSLVTCSPARWGVLDVSAWFPLGPRPASSDLLTPLGPRGSITQAFLSVGSFSGTLSPSIPLAA